MRLGFAVAIHVDPDVLLVDEVLAVGDEGFTHKCLDKFAEFRRRGKTILLVTHSLDLVERFCDEALWLDEGQMRVAGRSEARRRRLPDGVEKSRRRSCSATTTREGGRRGSAGRRHGAASRRMPDRQRRSRTCSRPTEGRWGSREVEITERDAVGAGRRRRSCFHSGEPMSRAA